MATLHEHNLQISHPINVDELFFLPAREALESLKIIDIDNVLATWGRYYNQLSENACFYEGVLSAIRLLYDKGKKILIVTSRNRNVTVPFCKKSNLEKYISLCVVAEDTKKHKPDPEPLEFAMKKLGLKEEETVYVGDSYNDYLAATAAGIKFVVAAWNTEARKLTGLQIDNPISLLKL